MTANNNQLLSISQRHLRVYSDYLGKTISTAVPFAGSIVHNTNNSNRNLSTIFITRDLL